MESLTPVTLVIKAPNQKIADQTIECALDWTVKKLKEHLSSVYPSKPTETQQRIIYSGQLLQDHLRLKDVLRQYEPNQQIHTVHLVCSPSTTDATGGGPAWPFQQPPQQQKSSLSDVPTSEGLRQRRGVQTSSSSMTSPAEQHQQPQQPSSPGLVPPMYGAFNVPVGGDMVNPFLQQMMLPMAGAAGFPMMPYNAEQMLWLQQYYTHYMAQYMQYQQQGIQLQGMQPATAATPTTPAAAAPRAEPAAAAPNARARQPEIVRMNAQGGPVVDDDDDDMQNHDWLDKFYMFVRFALLLCILYFYSTIGRFVATMGLITVLYLWQVGWFRIHRRAVRQPAPPRPQPAAADDNAAQRENNGDEANTAGNEEPTAPADPPAPGGLSLAWTFFVTFFSSLAPQQPAPVNAN